MRDASLGWESMFHSLRNPFRGKTRRLWDAVAGAELARVALDAALAVHGGCIALGDALGRVHVFDAQELLCGGSVSTRAKPDGASCRTSSGYTASRTASAAVARRR